VELDAGLFLQIADDAEDTEVARSDLE